MNEQILAIIGDLEVTRRVLNQELHEAKQKIAELEAQLAARPEEKKK